MGKLGDSDILIKENGVFPMQCRLPTSLSQIIVTCTQFLVNPYT